MSAYLVGNYGHQSVTDFSERPAEVGDPTKPRKAASPVIVQAAITLAQERKSWQMVRCHGMMPMDWVLERPGVRIYSDLDLAEAKARLVLEKLFISSLNLVLAVGDHLIQNEIAIPNRRRLAAKINEKGRFLQTGALDEAKAKPDKAAHVGRLMRWVAVAVTAVGCAAGRGFMAQEPSPAAIALCAYTLADALLEQNGSMEKSVRQIAGMLKQMGFNEKSANMVASTLAAVFAMAAMMTLARTIEESYAPTAAAVIAGNMTWAAKLAAKDSEATCAAIRLTDNCNYMVNRLRHQEEISASGRYPVTSPDTLSIEKQVVNLTAFMNEDTKNTNPIREEMIRCLQDVMTNTRHFINQAVPY